MSITTRPHLIGDLQDPAFRESMAVAGGMAQGLLG